MKKSVALLSVFSSVVNAEAVIWEFKKDYVLDGVITAPTTENLDVEILSNKFIGSNSSLSSSNIVQGFLEDKNNVNIGSGITERISFTISEAELTTFYLGQSNLEGLYVGTWYGPNNESGDFSLSQGQNRTAGPLVPVLTSNTSSSPIVISASTAHWHNNLEPWKAFNDDASHWSTGQCFEGAAGWLKVDFGTNKTVSSYKVRGRDDALTASYKDWVFEGSTDGATWVTVHAPASQTNWVVAEERTFTFPSVNYRYYRWNVSSGNGYIITCAQELQIEGY